MISEMLLFGTAGNTTGRGIELYEGTDRRHFQPDYRETSAANYNDKAERPNIAFKPGSRMKLFIQSGATVASGRLKTKVLAFDRSEL